MPSASPRVAYVTTYDEPLSATNFARLGEIIHGHCGIKMPSSKQTMLEGRLRRRLRSLGVESLDDYCRYLFEDGHLDDEMTHLIDAVTTNKTDFFREPVHFDYLKTTILPELLAAGRSRAKVWSAAASNGAESYTAAMVMEEFARQQRGFDYSILGTDICSEVIEQAIAGRFDDAMMAPVPAELRQRYVMRSKDPRSQIVRIDPKLRAKVMFGRLNLMDESYPVPRDFDVVFCRNILIYFDKPTQAKVLSGLCRHLRPGGYLILGHSESAVGADLPITPVANTIFRRR